MLSIIYNTDIVTVICDDFIRKIYKPISCLPQENRATVLSMDVTLITS